VFIFSLKHTWITWYLLVRCWEEQKIFKTVFDRAMAQAISHRPLTAGARVRSQVSPRGIFGGQSDTGTGFSPSTSVFPC
jgi:hypothetical protein